MSKNQAAVALGRLARGVPKKFSAAELARRTQRLAAARAAKAAKKKAIDSRAA